MEEGEVVCTGGNGIRKGTRRGLRVSNNESAEAGIFQGLQLQNGEVKCVIGAGNRLQQIKAPHMFDPKPRSKPSCLLKPHSPFRPFLQWKRRMMSCTPSAFPV